MAFWNRKREVKQAPPVGVALYYAGTSGANWMGADNYAKEGYALNAIAYACVRKIATACASVDLEVMQYVNKEKREVENHPLYELLERPNQAQGWAEFFTSFVSHRMISGNSYILRLPLQSQKPTEMWVLRPDRVRIHHDANGRITAYEYGVNGSGVKFPVDPITGYCDVMHSKEFNPIDDFLGLSPMAPAARNIDTVNDAHQWNKSLLQNGARPSGAYVMQVQPDGSGGKLSDEQFNRLREQLANDSTGAANAGRPLLLEGGLDWKEMSLSPKDMDFEKNLWASARMIATAYGVPPQLINVPGESTYSNMTEAKLSFWQDTVLPLLDNILDQLNNWLTPLYDKNIFIEYNEESIPALESRRWDKFDRLQNNQFMTINEKRRSVGMQDIEGGDVLLVTSGQVPIDILADAPQP